VLCGCLIYVHKYFGIRDSVLNTVTRSGRTVWGSNNRQEKDFFSSRKSGPAVGRTQPHFNWYRDSFLGLKWPERHVEHLPSSSAEVKNEWSLISSPFACPQGADGDNTLLYWINILSRK
jgi:hypothetical protein